MRQITYAFLISLFAFAASAGEDAGPGLLPTEEANVAPIKQLAATKPAVSSDREGRVHGSSVSDRLGEIRRRAVDADISRPFSVADETDPETIELHGALPAVPRRAVAKPFEKPISTRKPAKRPDPAPFEIEPAKPAPAATPPVKANPEPQPIVDPGPAPDVKSSFLPALPAPATPVQMTAEPARPNVIDAAPLESTPAPVVVKTKEIKKESDVLLSNRVPALSFETKGPKTIRIGREAQYRVTMHNNGKADARDVIVKVHLPVWAEVTQSNSTIGSPRVELDRERSYVVTWELGQLALGSKEDLILTVVPRDSRPFDLSVGWTLAAARSSTQIQVQEPKLEMTINGANNVLYGETAIYTIVLSNPGTGDVENVSLNLMPLTPQQDVGGTRPIGMLKAGERKTIELELTAHQSGNLQVRAIASGDGGLRADAAQDVVVRRANLDIAVIGPPRNYAGTEATYKVRIENNGDATAEQATASAVIPTSAQYLSSNDGGKFDSSGNRIEWNVGALRPGAVRVLEFRCVLETPGDNRIDISSVADGDLQITKSVVTNVEALADLKLFVNDPKGPISTGQDSVYEVRIVNRGSKIAENISVMGYFSEGIEPIDVHGWRGSIATGQVQFEPIGSLSPGQELVFRITARAATPGNHVFRAEVECSHPETRLALEEWTKYYGESIDVRQASRPMSRSQLEGPSTGNQSEFVLPEIRR